MTADLHTHTDASHDSSLSFDERVALTSEQGIDTVAITDHTAINERVTTRETRRKGVAVIAGIELSCTSANTRIDVLGLYIDPARMRARIDALETRNDGEVEAEDVIDWIHRSGGAAVLAHPGRYDVDLSDLVASLTSAGLDGMEIDYPYDEYTFIYSETPDMPKTPVSEITAIAREHGLIETGGSDCHGGEKTYAGLVRVDDARVEELRAASERYR